MAAQFFLVCGSSVLYIGSFNIHGVGSKLERSIVKGWFILHEIVLICETHTNKKLTFPGYKAIYGVNENPLRGGVIVFVKNHLAQYITNIDTSEQDQIWFRFTFLPSVQFGGCYIPPSDSTYYSESNHANILSKCIVDPDLESVVFGDLNSRVGSALVELSSLHDNISYIPVDKLQTPSEHGKKLLPIAKDGGLFFVNNMVFQGRYYEGSLTFRRRQTWISEVDVVLVSKNILPQIIDFKIDQSLSFPSDHAPISVSISVEGLAQFSDRILKSAELLGDHAVLHSSHRRRIQANVPLSRKVIQCKNVNIPEYLSSLDGDICDHILRTRSVDECVEVFSDKMYSSAKANVTRNLNPHPPDQNDNRWHTIMSSHDDKALWKAINWKGELRDIGNECPSDDAFREHLEAVLNPENAIPIIQSEYTSNVYLPLLDDPIDVSEVDHVIGSQIKSGKAAGLDGISPGLFKSLPAMWIIALTFIMNFAFYATYPARWSYAKLNMLHKKGSRLACDNFRGISIIESMSKIYDYILYNRLARWFIPDREQAGSQPKRSCIEQIVTLRLLISYAIAKRLKLYILFVDYSKAYDRVPRNILLRILISLGCSALMLYALVHMYSSTFSIIGSSVVTATIGVRQGSPLSGFLFIMFMNGLIRLMKQRCHEDGWLKWLHTLLLMDDAIILATSYESFLYKLEVLHEYCDTHGMLVNETKTKFMVINGNNDDRIDIQWYGIVIKHVWKYVYLGALFTSDGSMVSALKEHKEAKQCHLNKLFIFLRVNSDIPFPAKLKVLDAAYNAAILYGCESWIGASPKPMNTMYMSALKAVLGVRSSASNDLCLLELNKPSLLSVVRNRQAKFLRAVISERSGMDNDPLMFALSITRQGNRKMSNLIDSIMNTGDHVLADREQLIHSAQASDKSKVRTYLSINPACEPHHMYSQTYDIDSVIPEYHRIRITQMRISAHKLKVETLRWANTIRANRRCQCGIDVQDERHVLVSCPRTQHLRDALNIDIDYPIILNTTNKALCKFVYDATKVFY